VKTREVIFTVRVEATDDTMLGLLVGTMTDALNETGYVSDHRIVPDLTYHVEDNVTGQRMSKDVDTEDHADSICRSMNTPNSGGRYGVYDSAGRRC